MKENKGFSIACGLLTVSLFVVRYVDRYSDSILALLFIPAAFIAWIVLIVIAIIRIVERKHLPLGKRLVPLYALFLSFYFTAACIFFTNLIVNRLNWLLLESYDFTGSDNLLFKTNGEYEYWRGSPLGNSTTVRGHYEQRDSLLIMQPKPDGQMLPIARLAIRPYLPFQRRENSFVQLVALDSAGTMQGRFRIKERTE